MSKYNLADHKDEILTNIIKNLIWAPIAAIIPIIWKLLNTLYNKIASTAGIFTWENILSIVAILVSFVTIIINIFSLKRKNLAETKKKDAEHIMDEENVIKNFEPDYRVSSLTAEMTFNSRTEITSCIDCKMVVLAKSVTELNRDLIWSGSEYKGTKLVERNGPYEIIDSNRAQSPYPYTIVYNEEKKRGDKVEFKTETSVVDGKLDMSPVYSVMVKYQIDELIIRVVAPRNMLKHVNKVVYADRGRQIRVTVPEPAKKEDVGPYSSYTFAENNPTLLYNYFLEWEFT